MMTKYDIEISDTLFANKIRRYVNQFYKILPIKESGEPTLQNYMESLLREMLGSKALITALDDDPQYITLVSILEYMVDSDCDVATVKTEVFKAINILKQMEQKFPAQTGGDGGGRVGKVREVSRDSRKDKKRKVPSGHKGD